MKTPERWAIDVAAEIFGTEADTKELDLEATGLDASSAAEVYFALSYLHEMEDAKSRRKARTE